MSLHVIVLAAGQGTRMRSTGVPILNLKPESPEPDTIEQLSRDFEMCAYGLREVRREWERRDDDPSNAPLLFD